MNELLTPGDLIKKKMQERGWTHGTTRQVLGRSLPNVNLIITGKTTITPETAIQLAEAFGDSAEEWLLTESRYRLSLVKEVDEQIRERARLFDAAPVKDMQKRNWIKKTDSPEELEAELRRFFENEDILSNSIPGFSARKSDKMQPLSPSQKAWCYRAIHLARCVPAKSYSEKRFKEGMPKLQALTAWPEESRHASSILSEMGIRLVIIEPLPKSKIDGVAICPQGQPPIIALSIRYDRIDSFWHTLGHELSHVFHGDSLHIDENLTGEGTPSPAHLDDVERRADREAASMWVPEEELSNFILRVSPLYSKKKINGFASRIKVHPGIIVGQLQYRGEISYASHRGALEKIRSFVTPSTLTDGWGQVVEI